jgi:hypothetical protein
MTAYAGGGNKYYVVERNGLITVWKTAWMPGRDKVGEAHGLDDAFVLNPGGLGVERDTVAGDGRAALFSSE